MGQHGEFKAFTAARKSAHKKISLFSQVCSTKSDSQSTKKVSGSVLKQKNAKKKK